MQEKIQKMMDLLKSAKFNVITVDGKILLTIKIEDKEYSFTLNWDGGEDYWSTIDIGKYCYDVNVWIGGELFDKEENEFRFITIYPVIESETITGQYVRVHSEPFKREEEQCEKGLPIGKTNLQEAIEILEKHNAWRKGGEGEATDPKELTWALDLIILNFKNEKQ
jgi:hypothetical protein